MIDGARRPLPRRAPPAVEALGRALLDDLDPLTEQLVDAILAEDPSYSGPGRLTRDDLAASCRSNLVHVLRTLVGDDDPADPATLAPPRATGARRAEQGVPLESVLHAYRLGFRCIWEAMVTRARAGGEGVDALVDAATVVWEVVDLFSAAVADAYRRAEQDLLGRDARRRDALLDALLEGRGGEPSVLADAAAALDLPERGRYAVALVAGGGGLGAAALRQAGLRAAERARTDSDVVVVLLAEAGPGQVVDALAAVEGLRAGVSPAVDGLAAVDTAHRWARAALAALPDRPGTAELDTRLPAALVAAAPDLAARLVQRVLGGLLALPAAEADVLLETVSTWVDTGGSAVRTAERLWCHRNTVLNRLRRVEAVTGRSVERPGDVVELQLALLGLALAGTGPGSRALSGHGS